MIVSKLQEGTLKDLITWEKQFYIMYKRVKQYNHCEGLMNQKIYFELADGSIQFCRYNDYLHNMALWYPSVVYNITIIPEMVLSPINMDTGTYLEKFYITPLKNKVDLAELNKVCVYVIERFKEAELISTIT